jgi:hypothetical protein
MQRSLRVRSWYGLRVAVRVEVVLLVSLAKGPRYEWSKGGGTLARQLSSNQGSANPHWKVVVD